MQTDEENKRQELEEYVITRELRKHFGSFYSHYEQSVGGTTDKMGVWIGSSFGSGKSHFLKILSYLLANDVVAGRHAVDYFEEKLAYDPLPVRGHAPRQAGMPTETILFNIDAKSPMGKDDSAILRVFAKVFYEHCGFYGDDLKVAEFGAVPEPAGMAGRVQRGLRGNQRPGLGARARGVRLLGRGRGAGAFAGHDDRRAGRAQLVQR